MWPFCRHSSVDVSFADHLSGRVFARSRVPVDQLPDSFAPQTTMHIGDKDYHVAKAVPLTKPEFRRSGRLVLHVAPIATIDPGAILFSLPTVGGVWPEVEPAREVTGGLSIHEDDWRQVEFVSGELLSVVESEFAAIREIIETCRKSSGFIRIHVRERIPDPIGRRLTAPDLLAALGVGATDTHPVYISSMQGLVRGAASIPIGQGTWLYWLARQGQIDVLGIHGSPSGSEEPIPVLSGFGLMLVDWCGSRII